MGDRGVKEQPQEELAISDLYDRLFPEYLAMGMTSDEFWRQDCTLAIAYRKAYRLRVEEQNRIAWLQGLYMYKALQVTPIVVQGFARKGAKIENYPQQPYDFSPKKKKTAQEQYDEEVLKKTEKLRDGMLEFMKSINARNQKKKEKEKGVNGNV